MANPAFKMLFFLLDPAKCDDLQVTLVDLAPIEKPFSGLHLIVFVLIQPHFRRHHFSGHYCLSSDTEAHGYVSVVQLLLDAQADPWPRYGIQPALVVT